MVPEGIRPGDFCLISPGRAPQPGDRVWIREATNDRRVSIKRLVELTQSKAVVRGWMPPGNNGQQDFVEERPIAGIAEIYPVIGVYRGRLGKAGVDVQYTPDPRAGQLGRTDGLVPVELLAESLNGAGTGQFPAALGFPEAWLTRQGLRTDTVRLVAVTDDWLEPALPNGSVVLVDTARRDVMGKGLFAIRQRNSVLIRQIERMADGTAIIGGTGSSAQTSIVKSGDFKLQTVIGSVVRKGAAV